MKVKETIFRYHSSGPEAVGDIEWDSRTGELAGSLADRISNEAAQARQRGFVRMHQPIPSSWEVKISDPLRRPREFAALLESMGYFLPAALRRHAPKPPFRAKYNPNITY